MTRDPYDWSTAMCKHPYIVEWLDDSSEDPAIEVKSTCPNMRTKVSVWGIHENIMHFWNRWYREYAFDFPNPRIIVRLEDLTLRPRETVESICKCAGGQTAEKFHHVADSAKAKFQGDGHGPKEELTGMLKAWTRFQFPRKARGGLSTDDYNISTQSLDKELMDLFQYHPPPVE